MDRRLFRSVMTALASCALLACHDAPQSTAVNPFVGDVGVQLVLDDGSSVDEVSYTIVGGGVTRTGTIPVGNSATISAIVGGLPPGDDYTIMLSTGSDGAPQCSGTANFSVVSGQTTRVTVVIHCAAEDENGSASINATVRSCTSVASVTVLPAEVIVGADLALHAEAASGAPAFAWTAPVGTFSAPNSPDTAYTCTSPGVQTLTLTLTERSCTDSIEVEVTCTGAHDAGEPAPDRDAGSDESDAGEEAADGGSEGVAGPGSGSEMGNGFAGRGANPGRGGFAGREGMPGRGGVAGRGGFAGREGIPGRGGDAGRGGFAGREGIPGRGGVAGRGGFAGRGAIAGRGGFAGRGAIAGRSGEAGAGSSDAGTGGTGGSSSGGSTSGAAGSTAGSAGNGGIGGTAAAGGGSASTPENGAGGAAETPTDTDGAAGAAGTPDAGLAPQ